MRPDLESDVQDHFRIEVCMLQKEQSIALNMYQGCWKKSVPAKSLEFKCSLYGVMMIQAKKVDEGIRESSTEAILHFQISGPANLSLRWEIGAGGANAHTWPILFK